MSIHTMLRRALVGLGFAAMFALATFVDPEPREITVTVPNSKLPSR